MSERVHRCPNCGATLAPSRFARTATCGYCQAVVTIDDAAVSAARFRAARARLVGDVDGDPRPSVELAGERWLLGPLVARGEIADVYAATRSRPPTERALVKVLRDRADLPMLAAEWAALKQLRSGAAADHTEGAAALVARTPDPIAFGVLGAGMHAGSHATVLRYAPRFDHTFESVRAAVPGGVDARVAVWMWRRILEVLSLLHRSWLVHGAVLPPHLLVERGEHGVRLVGYGCAGAPGGPLAAIVTRHEALYPEAQLVSPTLSAAYDLVASARSVGYVLGVDGGGSVGGAAPPRLAALLDTVARGAYRGDAYALWGEVGRVAREVFGPPSFHPLSLPRS